ncbi:zf-HC2 domain-containing protein [Amycolatopsis sp. NPDC006131]|uniref:zf-HC2 domain-containing protein n=1 Tax=Amycolatopsis sp. NPDC006131 TaxID=3156731 RepID=UPI0033B31C9E
MVRRCPFTTTTASYLLGILSPQEHAEFDRHARMCSPCRREIEELTPVVRLLKAIKTDHASANGQLG